LVAALAISLAAHAAFIIAPWSRSTAGAGTPSAPAVIVARLLDADKPEAAAATTPEVAAALPPSDSVAAAAPRPDSSIVSEPPPSIPELPAPPRQEQAKPAAALPIPEPSDSASAAAPSRRDATDKLTPFAATAAGPSSGRDRGPQPLDDIEPEFPAVAGTRGGTVTLRLVVSDRGVVESVEVVRSSPPGLFDAAAVAAFGQARFSPGLKAGVPVRSEVLYEVSFAPVGRGSETSGRTY
jgi:protein TonB